MHPNMFLETLWRRELRHQVFVAMPFGDPYNKRFDQIFTPAAAGVNLNGLPLTAFKVDNSKTGESILTEIIDGIAHSQIILADVSTVGQDLKTGDPYRNSNVMYEVGLALACRQPCEVILVRDDTVCPSPGLVACSALCS